jgi:hypothetical protein
MTTEDLTIQQWVVHLDTVEDAGVARDGWLNLIRAQGWSPVGDPEVVEGPPGRGWDVAGKLVRHPGLTIADTGASAIRVTA